MSILLSANKISKNVGDKELFNSLSFGVFEKEKIGLIGPNGAGKSTLLRILAKTDSSDSGEVVYKKHLALAFVPQTDKHPSSLSVFEHSSNTIFKLSSNSKDEAEVLAATYLSITGFEDFDVKIGKLSGGWLKRLSLAIAIATEPELLILDEPTNHMDWDGVLWLEGFLKSFKQSFILVSHDRTLLENTTNRTVEINPAFKDGFLSYSLGYNAFLEKKEEYLENQKNLQSSMANKARRETEWLRAGVKARTTKSRSRMDEAHKLIDDLGSLNAKNTAASAAVNFQVDSTGRKTKKLIELKNLDVGFKGVELIKSLSLNLGPQQCYGLLGHNGSGKTSLLKTLNGELEPLAGEVKKAHDLKTVYFEQKRSELPQDCSLVEYLGDGSDYVIFKDQSIHVASYASKFLFSSDRLNVPIEKLSGGEQARLLIAKIFLKPADVLILDEPTNDLDIKTISILENMIVNFKGLVLLVSHDRSFLKSVCTHYLALNGAGETLFYADVEQWLKQSHKKSIKKSRSEHTEVVNETSSKTLNISDTATTQKTKNPIKLSYKDKKFLEDAESIILSEEERLTALNIKLETAVTSSNSDEIQELSIKLSEQQNFINELYEKWDRLNKLKENQ